MGLPPLKTIQSKDADLATYAMAPVRVLGSFVKKHFLKPVKMLAENSDVVDALLRKLEHQVKGRPTTDELKLYSRNATYSDALARSLLSYCPDTNIGQGMKASVDWIRYLGKINEY